MQMSAQISKKKKFKLITINQNKNLLQKVKNIFKFYDVHNFDIKIINPTNIRFFNKIILILNILKEIKFFETKFFISRSPIASLILLLLNCKIIVELHHPFHSKIFFKIFNFLSKKKNLVQIIVISKNLKKYLIENINHNIESKISVLPDSANQKQYNLIKSKINFSKKNIGYVGSFYKGRGIELIKKISLILKDFNFYLIGDYSNYKFHLKNFPKNVNFLGFKNQKSLKKYYYIFDIVLAPYADDVRVSGDKLDTSKFMSPLKIFEYMSNKKIIISSNNQVLKEILKNNLNCILCNYKNPMEWANKIRMVSSDTSLKKKISMHAHSDFKRKYTWEIRANKILNLIK
tara:strand:- start:140 stop:1180 length:1041 start_codon:yes stop_codon:yes gene_type:complete